MTDPNGARDTIEQLLFDGLAKGLVVDIIAMHPKVSVGSSSSSSDACQVWTTYMGAPHFMAHVKRCWDTFNLWNNQFKNDRTKWPGKLKIMAAYFLPVSINIVDPERQYGLLVISPRMAQEANSTRPQFIATKQYEPAVFNFYWETIRNCFDNSGWVEIDELPQEIS